MRIGLVDVDSHNFPNLCLMKLATYHKGRGDSVELLRPADVLDGQNLFGGYDKLYGACVFDWNRATADRLAEIGVEIGGTGTGRDITLPDKVEHMMPDYSLYGITDTAYGFLTRGCPRGCPFCIVAGKEGRKSRKVADLSEFWAGQKNIKLLDPNILAYPGHIELLKQLETSGAWIDFCSGVDCRLLNDENTAIINALKVKMIHFAWDNPRDNSIQPALLRFAKGSNLDYWRRKVYVLVNYWSTPDEDLNRVEWLRGNGYDPFVMIYDKANAPPFVKHLARYVNNKFIFWSCPTFYEYRGTVKKGARV